VRRSSANFAFRLAVPDDLLHTARHQHWAVVQLRPANHSFKAGGSDHTSNRERGIHISPARLKHDRKFSAFETPQKLLKSFGRVSHCLAFGRYRLDTDFFAIAVPDQSEIHRPLFGVCSLAAAGRVATKGRKKPAMIKQKVARKPKRIVMKAP
jgi:hypothetical protein